MGLFAALRLFTLDSSPDASPRRQSRLLKYGRLSARKRTETVLEKRRSAFKLSNRQLMHEVVLQCWGIAHEQRTFRHVTVLPTQTRENPYRGGRGRKWRWRRHRFA
jgi:hypothetical protein